MALGTSDEVTFINGALGLVPSARITLAEWTASIAGTGTSPNANWAVLYYDTQRKALLRSYKWNWATFRATLVLETITGYYQAGFGYQFRLPTGWLRMADPATDRWVIRGSYLRSQYSEEIIDYVKDITDPLDWDSLFYTAFQHHLASFLARSILHNDQRANELTQQVVGLLLPQAAAIQSQEGTPEIIQSDRLIIPRGGRGTWDQSWWPRP